MLVCFVIAAYYAVIIAWSLMYTIFSFTEAWGDDAEGYFFGNFLAVAEELHFGGAASRVRMVSVQRVRPGLFLFCT